MSAGASLGSLEVVWSPLGGAGAGLRSSTALALPCIDVHDPPLVAEVVAPTTGTPDVPFAVVLALHNRSSALAVLQRVLAGLARMHAAGLLHCDVHAGNVLVREGAAGTAALADLGSAQVLAGGGCYRGPTRGGPRRARRAR